VWNEQDWEKNREVSLTWRSLLGLGSNTWLDYSYFLLGQRGGHFFSLGGLLCDSTVLEKGSVHMVLGLKKGLSES
jgi:hypothetical protein